jgi:hypothetical protein
VRRQLLTGTMTTLVVALLGVPVGLLWQAISPSVRYVVIGGEPVLADPESQALISTDGRFAILTGLAGVVCGVIAYIVAGRAFTAVRRVEVVILLGLACGGIAAALLAWRAGHSVGLGTFQRLVAHAKDGDFVKGVADLKALGVLVCWPLAAVGMFGLLDGADIAGRHRPELPSGLSLGDGGGAGGGQPYQIGGGQFDLQSAPTGGDKDRREL